MDDAARLLAIEEISMLKARYFLAVDTKDWDMLREQVFVEEITFLLPENDNRLYEGREAVLGLMAEMKDWYSVHHGHMPIIELTSDVTATGLWAMEDRLYWATGGAGIDDELVIHGFGHYHETYVKRARGWRIETIKLTRLRRETRSII